MSVDEAGTEFVAPPAGGRTFSLPRRPMLGDCAPSGRLRLDALARMLQDVAYLDVDDAGVAHLAVWVVRRSRMRVLRFPRFGEHLTLTTYCSGLGRMWAERRTTVAVAESGLVSGRGGGAGGGGGGGNVIEAVSLWVHLDPESRRPVPLTPEEMDAYGDAASGRRVTARLRHPPPAGGAERVEWQFRAVDCDIAEHINNAAYWLPIEEELLAGPDLESLDVEIEYRAPAQPGAMAVVRDGPARWITTADGETHASIMIGGPAVGYGVDGAP
jgi:acyl-ACP thioesterase